MKKKTIIILSIILILITAIVISISKKGTHKDKNIISNENIDIKVNDIDYKIEKNKNNKDEILIYIKAKNNSNKDISYLSANISDGKNLETTIEYLQKIKAGATTDNYNDIKNSKDDRSKIPIKGKNGEYLKQVGNIKIKSISYVINSKMITYNYENKRYTIGNY